VSLPAPAPVPAPVAYADCGQPNTEALPCFDASTSTSGLCINATTCAVGRSTLTDLMAPEVDGAFTDIAVFNGSTTAEGAKVIVTFNTPLNISGRLLLADLSGFTRGEFTPPDGVKSTAEFSDF